jgi:hypothetical protein
MGEPPVEANTKVRLQSQLVHEQFGQWQHCWRWQQNFSKVMEKFNNYSLYDFFRLLLPVCFRLQKKTIKNLRKNFPPQKKNYFQIM